MKFSRFERKILAAIVAVAVMPLVGALLLGQTVLREAYQVGVNAQVRDELERGLDVYRAHFVALRHNAEQSADAVSRDHELRASLAQGDQAAIEQHLSSLLAHYAGVTRLRIVDRDGNVVADVREAEEPAEDQRQLDITREVDTRQAGDRLLVTVATPKAPFRDYQRAGEVVEVFRRLETGRGAVSGFYLVVYMGFLLSVIVIAVGVGVVISRRVTRRVSLLADATQKVGAGDLTVQVPTAVNDEIGDLTGAFNAMVRDMHDSRGRIEYLQRIGAWQEFARRLAHEIKNPLTPIQLAVQEANQSYMDGPPPDFGKRLAEANAIVREEVAALRRLVGEFSDFAKLPQASLQPADLNLFLQDSTRTFEVIGEEYRQRDTNGEVLEAAGPVAQVECVTGPGQLLVSIDTMMLGRCLNNLVRNALQALRDRPEGTEQALGRVVVEARRSGSQALLLVSDNGPGIDPAHRGRIFDPYYTTKTDGTGLGLPIVKKVVLEHNGEITCDDSDLGGVCFTIRIPIRR